MTKLLNFALVAIASITVTQSFSSTAKAGLCESNRAVIDKAQQNLTSLEKMYKDGAVSRVSVLQAEKQLLDLKLCQSSENQDAFAGLVKNTLARQTLVKTMIKNGFSASALDAVLVDGEVTSLTNACDTYKPKFLELYKGGEKTQAAVDVIDKACADLGK